MTSVRWCDPQDGGRGREVRGRWSVVRFFSWKYGTFYRRGRRWYTPLTWHVLSLRNLLLGVWVYRDDDEDWNVELGLGPLLHLHLTVTAWPRPEDRDIDPLIDAPTEAPEGETDADWRENRGLA